MRPLDKAAWHVSLPWLADVATHTLEHRFDLLGSGWTQVRYGMEAAGIRGVRYPAGPKLPAAAPWTAIVRSLNPANRRVAAGIAGLIDEPAYVPIDWHVDFKSGYRWQPNAASYSILYGHKPGVDVKLPWELARMQHLMVLATAYAQSGAARYQREFRNQVLDFIAQNPPRFGVNWRCTMDVGIRVANWLIAYDVFKAAGAVFDARFEAVFKQSVLDHGRHCIENLEYSESLRSNHYLADIAGLIFAAAYLPRCDETDAWLAFGAQELLEETQLQFHAEGSNFEASTCYHRLSLEMALYAGLVLAALPAEKREALSSYRRELISGKPPLKPARAQAFDPRDSAVLPAWFWNRLERGIEFAADATKPNGDVAQIGDNDSGRFVKAQPAYQPLTTAEARNRYRNLEAWTGNVEPYWDESILDLRHLLAAGAAVFGREDWSTERAAFPLEAALVQAYAKSLPALREHERNQARLAVVQTSGSAQKDSGLIPLLAAPGLLRGAIFAAYPAFGLFIWRSPSLFFAVRCGSIGQNGNGGHAHNDQLALELQWQGQDILRDPGTYLYTPFPEERRRFRSVTAHAAPWPADLGEQNDIAGTFTMREQWRPQVGAYGPAGIEAKLEGKAGSRELVVRIEPDQILVNGEVRAPTLFSNGYGKLIHD
jgi:hypothetical protein